eukprot:scpid111270/ scgid0247/ 
MAEVCSLRLWKGVAMAILALHLSSITGEGLTAAGSNPYLSCVDLAAHPGQTVVLVCPTGDRFQVFPSQRVSGEYFERKCAFPVFPLSTPSTDDCMEVKQRRRS